MGKSILHARSEHAPRANRRLFSHSTSQYLVQRERHLRVIASLLAHSMRTCLYHSSVSGSSSLYLTGL